MSNATTTTTGATLSALLPCKNNGVATNQLIAETTKHQDIGYAKLLMVNNTQVGEFAIKLIVLSSSNLSRSSCIQANTARKFFLSLYQEYNCVLFLPSTLVDMCGGL
eukprot:scpid107702/ scgid26684/ 